MHNEASLYFKILLPNPVILIEKLEKMTGLSFKITDSSEKEISLLEENDSSDILFFVEHPNFNENLFITYDENNTITVAVFIDDEKIYQTYLFLAVLYVLKTLGGQLNKDISIPEWAKVNWEIAKDMEGVTYQPHGYTPPLSPERQLHNAVDAILWEYWFPLKIEDISKEDFYKYGHWNAGLIFRHLIHNEPLDIIIQKLQEATLHFKELPSDIKICTNVAKKLVEARSKIIE